MRQRMTGGFQQREKSYQQSYQHIVDNIMYSMWKLWKSKRHSCSQYSKSYPQVQQKKKTKNFFCRCKSTSFAGCIQDIVEKVSKHLNIRFSHRKFPFIFLPVRKKDPEKSRGSGFPKKFFLDVPCLFHYNRCSAQKRGNVPPNGKKEVQKTMKMTFQPKKKQRSREHGFRKRMRTANGRKVLAARRKKGRKVLSA